MANINKIKLPGSNTTYDIEDAVARAAIEDLNTVVATDPNSDGNIVLRPYLPSDVIQVDKTLTIEGAAADAKAVGDRIKNITTSGDTPVLDAVLDANGIMTYNNSPAFNEWLTEDEGNAKYAPAGLVMDDILVANETELETALSNILNKMTNLTVRHVAISSTSGDFMLGVYMSACIFKRSSTHAQVDFTTYSYYGGLKWSKSYYQGVWQPIEWVNPPMILETEYRTTEKHHGYVVYTKLMNIGKGPTSGAKYVAHNIANISQVIRTAAYIGNGNETLPAWSAQSDWRVQVYANKTNFNISVSSDQSSHTFYAQIWYTK